MKILITNVYCYKNKGDAAIVISMIQNLKKTFPEATVKLISLYPEEDKKKYGSDIEVLNPILQIQSNKNKILNIIYRIFNIYWKRLCYKFKFFYNKTERCINDADLIISCGGGYMQSHGIKKFFTDYSSHYLQLLCSVSCKKKLVIFAQTIGPFDNYSKKLTKKIFEKSKLILVREKRSLDYVNNNFNLDNVYLTSDSAFLLEKRETKFDVNKEFVNIGITAREWIYPNSNSKREKEIKNLNYINSMASFIDKIIEKKNAFVYLMPQCIGPNLDNDILISKEIIKKVNNKDKCIIIDEDYSPEELKFIYGKMDYFIGTRMHSNIFALSEGIPSIAISYDYKTDGIMNLFDMDKYVIKIEDINSDILYKKMLELMEDKHIKESILEKYKKICMSSKENYTKIKKLVDYN